MVLAYDFLVDTSKGELGDVVFSADGDLLIRESDVQHELFIFQSFPGWYRENLLCGVGIHNYILATGGELELQRIIRIQLERDNYDITTVSVKPNFKTGAFDIFTSIARIR